MPDRLSRRSLLVSGLLAGGAALTAPGVSVTTAHADEPGPGNEFIPFPFFNAALFNDEALFCLGAASAQTGEVGEVLMTIKSIIDATGNPADPTSEAFSVYVRAFRQRSRELARTARRSSDPMTIRQRHMRASMYAAQSLFFVLGSHDGGRERELFNQVDRNWQRAIATFGRDVERFSVMGAGARIPCYFFRPNGSSKRRPTLIISEGSDGQNVETMQFGVVAGLQRGYNVVLFEGPGQMSLLFRDRIPFTPHWNTVVGPIARALRRRDDVGKIGVVGVSFAGMLCARVAAKVKDIDAAVLQPAAYSFADLWGDQETIKQVRELQKAPPAERKRAAAQINAGFAQAWPSLSRTAQFTIYKRGEIFSKDVQKAARSGTVPKDYYGLIKAFLAYDFTDDYRQIRIPTLLTANEGDEFFRDQAKKAYSWLRLPKADKRLVTFTAKQGAQLHDQPMGPQVVQEVVFDWLNRKMR